MLTITVAASVLLTAGNAAAQNDPTAGGQPQRGRRQRQGTFDPAQFQQRMMERYRERLEITDDTEWKAIEPLVQSVVQARMAVGQGGRGGFARGGRRGGNGNAASPSQPSDRARSNPAAEALQKAIDAKAPASELKTLLAKYVEDRKVKQADLERAQTALRAVLTARQEAIASLSGLL